MEEISRKGVDRMKKKETPRLAIRDSGSTTWVPQDKIDWIWNAETMTSTAQALGGYHGYRPDTEPYDGPHDGNGHTPQTARSPR